jgi:hypothetical protein
MAFPSVESVSDRCRVNRSQPLAGRTANLDGVAAGFTPRRASVSPE